MKKVFLSILLLIPLSCQVQESLNGKDYAASLSIVTGIRDKFGFIPMKYVSDDFSVSAIDFNGHNGMQKIGVENLVIDRKQDGIIMMIASDSEKLNKAVVETKPNETGFQSSITLKDGSKYSLDWIKDKSINVKFVDKQANLSQIDINKDRTHDEQLLIAFKLPVYVLFAIRELYFQFLISKMPEEYLIKNTKKVENTNSSARVADAPNCETFASVYAEIGCAIYTSQCEIELGVRLNQRCWNTYCTGCCKKTYDSQCLPGLPSFCVIFGAGHRCTNYPTAGTGGTVGGDCPPNKPCPLPFDPYYP
jgi:hypothetical protein